MKKLAVYVDGFNLYHALRNLKEPHFKWLNLRLLAEKFVDKSIERIEKVYYFSAIATHLDNPSTIQRHQTYIEALQTFNIEFVKGHFKKKPLHYRNQHLQLLWQKHEEKETDVNIATFLVRDAIKHAFDKMLLITNDTDIIPAIKIAREENHDLQIKLLTPPTYRTHDALLQATGTMKPAKILPVHIEHSLLPTMIKKTNGKIIRIPEQYKKTAPET